MKRYTQADFNALVRDADGYLHLPTGDWRGVGFCGADKLIFANSCTLGDYCTLGNWCTLGSGCKLGNGCALGSMCDLDDFCKLGDGCVLGDECTMGNWCKLGDACSLGDSCVLGSMCKIGTVCEMENGRVQNAAFFFASNIGSENRTAYAYCNTQTGDIYVRAGCWFSGLDDFINRVRDVHGGTQHATDYLAFAEFARARFARYKVERP